MSRHRDQKEELTGKSIIVSRVLHLSLKGLRNFRALQALSTITLKNVIGIVLAKYCALLVHAIKIPQSIPHPETPGIRALQIFHSSISNSRYKYRMLTQQYARSLLRYGRVLLSSSAYW